MQSQTYRRDPLEYKYVFYLWFCTKYLYPQILCCLHWPDYDEIFFFLKRKLTKICRVKIFPTQSLRMSAGVSFNKNMRLIYIRWRLKWVIMCVFITNDSRCTFHHVCETDWFVWPGWYFHWNFILIEFWWRSIRHFVYRCLNWWNLKSLQKSWSLHCYMDLILIYRVLVEIYWVLYYVLIEFWAIKNARAQVSQNRHGKLAHYARVPHRDGTMRQRGEPAERTPGGIRLFVKF